MIDKDRLIKHAKTIFDIEIPTFESTLLSTYANEMLEWPSNLTAITNPKEIEIRHFLDSLSLLHYFNFPSNATIADIGTGAGFPSMVLKIIRPDLDITLIESVKKKTAFLEHLKDKLGIDNVNILPLRAETVGQDPTHRGQYDWVTARAVAKLPTLIEYMLPLCKIGGYCIAMKGSSALAELRQAEDAIEVLGGKFATLHTVQLPEVNEPHMLVVIEKIRPTPSAFPRREGIPTKRPILSEG